MMNRIKYLFLVLLLCAATSLQAQDTLRNKKTGNYKFTTVKSLDANPVEDQYRSGTCWSFSSLSFIESELMRMGKGKHNLSEMFIVRNAYLDKAEKYVRMHGEFNFSPGGAFHDIPYIIKRYGIVPEEAYKGLNYGSDKHMHNEMDAILKSMVETVVKNPNKSLTSGWKQAVAGAIDGYLGEVPSSFQYQGKTYTPESFAKSLGLNMDDYVAISSFTHHPFYEKFVIEVPDNWTYGEAYNVPLDEMIAIMDNAINTGYTFAWGADVSEKGFSFRDGLAIVPEDESTIRTKGQDNANFSDAGAEKISNAFDEPVKQKTITQEMRQTAFDNYETTDDHGMHVTGIVKDQNGTKYYVVKNSWGTKYNDCDGYFYASEQYVRYKTINIMVHKDALPKDIAKKLGISRKS